MRRLLIVSLALLALLAAPAAAGREFPCRWAPRFNCSSLATDAAARAAFLRAVVEWEANFHAPGVGYNAATGHTYDGHPIDYTAGTLAGQLHDFSAPSKESIHVALPALAVGGGNASAPAAALVGGAAAAVDLLGRKMAAYEAFNRSFPGYGGYLPWVRVSDAGLVPTDDWVGRVPALDNGEWLWALYAAQHVLEANGQPELAARYGNYFALLAATGQTIFLEDEESGRVRAVVRILNVTAAPTSRANYQREGDGFLDDPYEGELFCVFLDLFGTWATDAQRDALWAAKRAKFQAVDFAAPAGPITVQRGWWFSSHEQWKLLMLPYLRVPLARRVFANCERARGWHSAMRGVAGLYASVNDVTGGSLDIPDYVSAAGVQSIAFQPVERQDIVTGYGAYPMFLFEEAAPAAYCWFHRMLVARRGQGPYGSTEALALNGTMLSPLVTWDSKMTTVLAMLGGISDLVGDALRAATPDKYQRFLDVVQREHARVFPSLRGEEIPFAMPTASIPEILSDFTQCQEPKQ